AMPPKVHIWALRLAIVSVATFAVVFSLAFTQTSYITLWWSITMGIFTGGAGAAIIGGLYWKKGTTSAAWAAAITGSVLSFIGIICGSFWPWVVSDVGPALAWVGIRLPAKFWFNNQVSGFLAAVIAAITYL